MNYHVGGVVTGWFTKALLLLVQFFLRADYFFLVFFIVQFFCLHSSSFWRQDFSFSIDQNDDLCNFSFAKIAIKKMMKIT